MGASDRLGLIDRTFAEVAIGASRSSVAMEEAFWAGDESWDVGMEIRLYRPYSRQSDEAEDFWSLISTRSQELSSECQIYASP